MKIVNKYTTLLSLCAAFAACSDNEVLPDNPSTGIEEAEKTPIVLSVGGVDSPSAATTRASSSAVITTGENKEMQALNEDVTIFMVMKSEYGTSDYSGSQTTKYTVCRGDVINGASTTINGKTVNVVDFDDKNKRYWDDAHARSSMLSIWGFAQRGIPQRTGWLSGTFYIYDESYTSDTDEPGYKPMRFETATTNYPWYDEAGSLGKIYPVIMTWKTSHNPDASVQDGVSTKYQDLLFTNNLANNTAYSKGDNRLKFNFVTRKFPTGEDAQLKFYHAMSKITIHIKKGDGFTENDPFEFAEGTNIKLSGLNTEGTFNIKEGEFQQTKAPYDIKKIYQWETPATGDAFTLEALAIPNIHPFMLTHSSSDAKSRFVKDEKDPVSNTMMEFSIDNNKYKITSGQLFDALHIGGNPENALVTNATLKTDNGYYIPLEAGKNYVFTFTVGKTKIKNITAQVADWENVNADMLYPSNARIKLQLEERGNAIDHSDDSRFSFYRSTQYYPTSADIDDNFAKYDWKTGYVDTGDGEVQTTPTYDGTHSRWTTTWYWESNKHFYHFRALGVADNSNPVKLSVPTTTITSATADYIEISSATDYTDICWGAPMKDDGKNEDPGTFKWNYGPTINGFDGSDTKTEDDHQIYKAIGPTEDAVKLILFHMMSDLTFNIKTKSGAEAVTLKDGSGKKTKVEIVGYYPTGKLLLGNGLVQTTNDAGTSEVVWNNESPTGTHIYKYGAVPQDLTNVKLYITTPDDNQYIVDLKDVMASSITTNNIANPYTAISEGEPNAGKYKIGRWYPGFKYTYSFTLAKTGITNLQATIVDWETVTADDEKVQIR